MTQTGSDIIHQIAFASLRGMNPTLARELLSRIGSEEAFFSATERQLSSLMGFTNRIFDRAYRDSLIEKARREADFISAGSVRTVYFTEADYPRRLLEAEDAPLLLYTLGNAPIDKGRMLSIVGTRHATSYGISFVDSLLRDLKDMMADPITIVSGLALGIDAAAHKASLRNSIPTAAVLAHGLNMIYPAQHRSLAAEIVRSDGVLITEYSSADPVHKGNFIARNRIVAALSDATLVVESAQKGGALITARLAAGYNRDVFALPGRTSDRFSQGCNRLIADNSAALIQSADDLIKAMNWNRTAGTSNPSQPLLFPDLSDDEESVMACLRDRGEAHISQISLVLNRPVSKVMALLIDMEFKNLIMTYPGGKYRLK